MEERLDAGVVCLNNFMDKTRRIINDNKDKFPEFQYYHNIIDKIEENVEKMPDVAIESCKSLVEGSSKTILNKLKIPFLEKGRDADTPRGLLKKVLDNIPDTSYDPEFITRSCELITRMTEIRNRNGDISHGKFSPKKIESDVNLAEYIIQITDSTMHYLFKIYFSADLSYIEETKYEDNEEFNEFLDSDNELEGIIYSQALFDQDIISYKEQLNTYLSSEEEEKK